jgi:hypothetical protein
VSCALVSCRGEPAPRIREGENKKKRQAGDFRLKCRRSDRPHASGFGRTLCALRRLLAASMELDAWTEFLAH